MPKTLLDRSEVLHRLRVMWQEWEASFQRGQVRLAAKMLAEYYRIKKLHHEVIYGYKLDPHKPKCVSDMISNYNRQPEPIQCPDQIT